MFALAGRKRATAALPVTLPLTSGSRQRSRPATGPHRSSPPMMAAGASLR